jgi:hypothetical protein
MIVKLHMCGSSSRLTSILYYILYISIIFFVCVCVILHHTVVKTFTTTATGAKEREDQ